MANKGLLVATVIFMGACIVALIFIFVTLFAVPEVHAEDTTEEIRDVLTEALEKAYMEGQIDALSGDVRVKEFGTDWMWTKSPWDEHLDKFPIYAVHEYYSNYSY